MKVFLDDYLRSNRTERGCGIAQEAFSGSLAFSR